MILINDSLYIYDINIDVFYKYKRHILERNYYQHGLAAICAFTPIIASMAQCTDEPNRVMVDNAGSALRVCSQQHMNHTNGSVV